MIYYEEYEGIFEYDEKSNLFKGKVAYIKDEIKFQGNSVNELKQSLQKSVEVYLKKCQEESSQPNKPIRTLKNRQKHDEGYKNLFSHPIMIKTLLTDYIKEDWIKNLDFSTLEKMNSEFIVSNKLKKRANDVVWKIKYNTSQQILMLYILLEFQSRPDKSMPVRLMVYRGLLYLEIMAQNKFTPSGELPPILSIVLYNGKEKWHIKTNIKDIVATTTADSDQHQADVKYSLINEQNYSNQPSTNIKSCIDALFRIEKSQSIEELTEIVKTLIKFLEKENFIGLNKAFAHWMIESLIPSRFPDARIPELEKLEEVNSMLYENAQSWYDAERRKGIEIGVERGINIGVEKGKEEGKLALILKLLHLKFSVCPAYFDKQISTLSQVKLDDFSINLLSFSAINEVKHWLRKNTVKHC